MPETPTVVLVHGAFADASGWGGVITELQSSGIRVIAPPNPLRGLAVDAPYIASVADQQGGPVVLCGHSYGGLVITQAASLASNVVGLGFVASLALDEGESFLGYIGQFPDTPLGAALVFSTFPVPGSDEPGTEATIDAAAFHDAFCADLPAETAAVMAVSQRPGALDGFGAPMGAPGWKTRPSWFVVATADRAIHPDAQRATAERAGSNTIEVDGSHSVATAQPRVIADHFKALVAATG
jgi:pimeloyl-ACP methyl ester carboxylesterase